MDNSWRYLNSLRLIVVSPDDTVSAPVDSDMVLVYLAEGGIIDPEPHIADAAELRALAVERLLQRRAFTAMAVEGYRNSVLAAVEPAGRA
jgi:hypothetical protein